MTYNMADIYLRMIIGMININVAKSAADTWAPEFHKSILKEL